MEEMTCTLCGGVAYPLGSLGYLMHYRCRNCGGQFSEPVEDRSAADAPRTSQEPDADIQRTGGRITWTHRAGDRYAATGVLRNGRRFRIVSASWRYINRINVWQGSKWLLRDGRRYRLQSVSN